MGEKPEQDASFDALAARIREAKNATRQGLETKTEVVDKTASASASKIGFDFVASVLVCGGLGWLLDRTLDTRPVFSLLMVLVGFAVGFFNVWRALNGYGQTVGFRAKDGKK